MATRVLLAEDSQTEAVLLRSLLRAEGFEVEVAPNGRMALDRLEAFSPHLVISDVEMPEMDGFALCRAVKSNPSTRSIPVVLLTGRDSPADILEGLSHGADNFLTKPAEPAFLLERIRRILDLVAQKPAEPAAATVEVRWNGRDVPITADRRQILELLFAKAEEVGAANDRLERSRAALERQARELEARVQERTRLLQHTLEGYRELVEGVEEMVFACDHRGMVTSVNAAATRLLGLPEEAIVGRSLGDLVHAEARGRLAAAIEEATAGTPDAVRIPLLAGDGSIVPVELRMLALMEAGAPVGWQGMARRIEPGSGQGGPHPGRALAADLAAVRSDLAATARLAAALRDETGDDEERRRLAAGVAALAEQALSRLDAVTPRPQGTTTGRPVTAALP